MPVGGSAAHGAGPIDRVVGGFGRRASALDFAFFKLNLPEEGIALLVDFIVRRGRGVGQVRASLHAPAAAGVHWLEQPLAACRFGPARSGGAVAEIGRCRLGVDGTAGSVGPVTWELALRASGPALVPLPPALEPLRATDMFLRSAPQVTFSGAISVPGSSFLVRAARGMVSSYHGRALPPRWSWVSCNLFDRRDVALECMVVRTRLFGASFARVETGYFHLRTGDDAETIVSPFPGRIELARDGERLTLVARRRGGAREHRVTCSAPASAYHDLGDGIRTTLVGSCELAGVARADGTAGLEERADDGRRASPRHGSTPTPLKNV